MEALRKQAASALLHDHGRRPQVSGPRETKLRCATHGYSACHGGAMKFWKKLRYVLKRDSFDRDLQEEMRFHCEMAEEKLSELGGQTDAAHYESMKRFGNATLAQEDSRSQWMFFFERLCRISVSVSECYGSLPDS